MSGLTETVTDHSILYDSLMNDGWIADNWLWINKLVDNGWSMDYPLWKDRRLDDDWMDWQRIMDGLTDRWLLGWLQCR